MAACSIRRMAGEDPRASIALIELAQRLSPRDPRTFLWLLYAVWCHWKLGETAEMEARARRSIALYANIPWNWLRLAAALALQGRLGEAREAIEPVRTMMPGYTPSRFLGVRDTCTGRGSAATWSATIASCVTH